MRPFAVVAQRLWSLTCRCGRVTRPGLLASATAQQAFQGVFGLGLQEFLGSTAGRVFQAFTGLRDDAGLRAGSVAHQSLDAPSRRQTLIRRTAVTPDRAPRPLTDTGRAASGG
jgi:hypothetical protein